MAQSDNHPDPETPQGRQHWQELAPHQLTVPSGQNAGSTSSAQNADTHPFPLCSTWHSAETLDIHCTVDDRHRRCCRLLKKKSGSPNCIRRARSFRCILQCGPLTTARLCVQHQHTGNNPSLALRLYAEQTT